MNYLVIDTETTIKNKGHPFTPSNKLCVVGIKSNKIVNLCLKIEYDDEPFGTELHELQEWINDADLIVFFNAKFDLHWLRRYGIYLHNKHIWDCQLAHFLITNQSHPFPGLNDVSSYYNLGQKLDVIKEEFWNKGIDTPEIPWLILTEYLYKDLDLTEQIYLKQKEEFENKYPEKKRLLSIENQDLFVLEEMEWNGIQYDVENSIKEGSLLEEEIKKDIHSLNSIVGYDFINWNSGDDLSAVLYGGKIGLTSKISDGVFKTGKRAGLEKFKNVYTEVILPRLVTPTKGSELKKEGFWETNKKTLQSLKAKGKAKKILDIVLNLSKKEKELGTYLYGIPNLIKEMEWEDNIIHGNLNKCVVITGRLSSTKPNMQNLSPKAKALIKSRF